MPSANPTDYIRELLFGAGACAVGVAPCQPVPESELHLYGRWIGEKRHGDLGYMTNYPEVRRDPRELLPGARSIIMTAFRYPSPDDLVYAPGHIRWARYAVGDDYHDVIRRRLTQVAETLGGGKDSSDSSDKSDLSDLSDLSDDSDKSDREAGRTRAFRERAFREQSFRVTVDTAPMRERYHAWRAGLGFFGLNGQLIVPGLGSSVLLGAIITTLELPPSQPLTPQPVPACRHCRRCVTACPGQALDGHGGVDARKCLSCLTIENRDPELPAATLDHLRATGRIYGCDICQEVCPLSSPEGFADSDPGSTPQINPAATVIPEFLPRPALLELTPADLREMDQPTFSTIFARSAVKRAKLAGLRRNSR